MAKGKKLPAKPTVAQAFNAAQGPAVNRPKVDKNDIPLPLNPIATGKAVGKAVRGVVRGLGKGAKKGARKMPLPSVKSSSKTGPLKKR